MNTKKILAVFIILLSLIICSCSNGTASNVEVVYAIEQLQDFKEISYIVRISAYRYSAYVIEDYTEPKIDNKNKKSTLNCDYIVIYKTKSDGFKLVTLSASPRPPTITGVSKEFK